jgi:hypothetical protein
MIEGNSTWTLALAKSQKQPYYALEIADFSIVVASYGAEAQVSASADSGGYGKATYGVSAYGT